MKVLAGCLLGFSFQTSSSSTYRRQAISMTLQRTGSDSTIIGDAPSPAAELQRCVEQLLGGAVSVWMQGHLHWTPILNPSAVLQGGSARIELKEIVNPCAGRMDQWPDCPYLFECNVSGLQVYIGALHLSGWSSRDIELLCSSYKNTVDAGQSLTDTSNYFYHVRIERGRDVVRGCILWVRATCLYENRWVNVAVALTDRGSEAHTRGRRADAGAAHHSGLRSIAKRTSRSLGVHRSNRNMARI